MAEMAGRMKRAEQAYSRKIKDAVHILFFKHHRLPGVRGWELRQELGPEWLDIITVLDDRLKPLDLQVTKVFNEPELYDEPTTSQLSEARFYITMRGTVDQKIAKTIGWRVDDIAGLAVTVAYIISKRGKAPKSEVEKILEEKLPGWRVRMNLDKYIEEGYLGEDDQGYLYLDWRSRAEIDQKNLVDLIVAFGKRVNN
jgi:hypothetical protein